MKILQDFLVAFVSSTLVLGLVCLYGHGLLTLIQIYVGFNELGFMLWVIGMLVPLLSFAYAVRDK